MNTIGIKLADGSFYSILDDGEPSEKALVLTTAKDNQTRVLVDLYRSATDSMEDAEYVDSLQIDNLVEHPNGSANISLNIALDENGKLSATINDPETGASSSSNITLVTRTAEERRAPADYDIVEPQPEPAGPSAENAKAERTGGLLAAASAAASSSDEPVLPDFDGSDDTDDDTTLTADELSGIAESAQSDDAPDLFDDIQQPDSDNDKTPAADTTLPDTDAAQSSDETPPESQADIADSDEPVLPDFDGSDNADNDTTLTADELSGIAESAQSDDTQDSFDDIQLSDSDNDKTPAADTTLPDTDAAQSSDETLTETQLDAASEDLVLPDFDLPDIEAPVDTAKENPADFDLPDFSGFDTAETSLSASPLPDFDLPDFKEPETAESESPIDFDLPDFSDFDTQTADKTSDDADESPFPDFALPDFEETDNSAQQDAAAKTADASAFDDFQTLATDNPFPDFDLPDFPEESFSEKGGDVSLSDSDFMDDLNTMTFDDEPSSPFAESGAGGINFDGLYDKETLEGHSAGDGDEIKKKTKLPVIICVICAVICIIATALILFVLPTNYNILSRARMQNEEPVQSLTQKDKTRGLEPEPVIPPVVEAKEEEIVVAPEPEQVVPEAPKEPIKKAGDTLYTIKWGDTLWDISDAYYKTPWEFQMIADYNNISDPDYIVSGTTIKLPPK